MSLVQNIWPDQTVVILGGGPSLTLCDLHKVACARFDRRCRVIAVNDSVYVAWWCDWLHAADAKWWFGHIQRVQNFRGIKTTLADGVPTAWGVIQFRNTGIAGFDPDPTACSSGRNGGYQAVHAAMHAGAKRIILLGFDMKGGHWHDGHPGEPLPDYARDLVPVFETLAAAAQERGVEIINCTPDSALTCFDLAPLDTVLGKK